MTNEYTKKYSLVIILIESYVGLIQTPSIVDIEHTCYTPYQVCTIHPPY
jgi:hypothetical protein